MFKINEIIDTCVKRKISPNQLLYLYSMYKGKWADIYKYLMEVKCLSYEDLQYLEEEGYIINWKNNKTKELKWEHSSLDYFDKFEVTDKFKRLLFIDSTEAGEELFEIYPKFVTVGDKKVPTLKGDYYNGKPIGRTGQIYYGKDELVELYGVKINNNYLQHQENIEGIKKAIKCGVMLPIIRSYIIDEMWLSINTLKESEEVYNNVQTL